MVSSYLQERRRSRPNRVALILTIAVHAIVLLLLLLQKGEVLPIHVEQRLTAFLLPEAKEEKPDSGDKSKKKAATKAGEEAPVEKPKPPEPPPPAPETKPAVTTPSFLNMTSSEFAAADISKMASARKDTGNSGDSKSTYGPGEGPGGVRLYDPDWYRRPTSAQLATYIPSTAPSKGWGLVACKTVENYHVDDCQTLGESPLGSGFGRAVREAAWQFLVLPPRINGRPVIGAWVRIRITYGEIAEPG